LICKAYDYYEECKTGLGERFLNTLEDYLDIVLKNPQHYQIKRKPYREALIKDFPYLIIFEIEADKVIVYAVFNTWRNPDKKPK
jgi:hypothetical protein